VIGVVKVVFLATVFFVFASAQEPYPTTCGDLLAELHRKPEHLKFLECRPHPNDQTKPLVAEYRVEGVYAEAVKRYLLKTFVPVSNRKGCCASSPAMPSVTFEWKDGKTYDLAFRADELGARTRAQRLKVPHFVTFSRQMEQP
jgi:hypothetical protein